MCMCVCKYACVRACMRACVYVWVSPSTRSILTVQVSFSLFIYVIGVKNSFFDWADAFLFYFEFWIFSKFIFAFF